MELWFIYGILASIFGGLYSFSHKIAAEKNYSSSKITMYNLFYGAIFASILLIFNFDNFNKFFLLCGFVIINTISYVITLVTRIDSLKLITSNIFFPISRILSSLLSLFVGFLFFNETITKNQTIGILIGFLVIILLIEKKENEKQKNLKKGLFLLLISSFALLLTQTTNKIVASYELGIFLFMFLANLLGTFNSYYLSHKEIKTKKKFNEKNIHIVGFLTGLIQFLTYFFSLLALKTGSLGIFAVIYSFSIIIPIILSIFIYNEKLDLKKSIALFLMIVSMFLLK
jgi:drug/metabolite transporter (DMT)-like permease